ncbi:MULTISPECIES: ash family protein [Proteus]|uniref:ash family protein n=1 Tax=Proteus TaxID=583 RepID=UPI00192A0A0D
MILYWRHINTFRILLCCSHSCTSMVGWTVASKGAPVSNRAGKANSVQFTTSKIGLFSGEFRNYLLEAVL